MPELSAVAGTRDVVVEVVLIEHLLHLVSVGLVGRIDCAVATMIRYRGAPATANQRNVGVVGTPIAPLEGLLRRVIGNVFSVVKLHFVDQ